jgi:uncharacterized protein YjcR
MNSEDIAKQHGVNPSTVRNWAAKNGVGRKQVGSILAFDWTEEDIARFLERPRPGWKRGRGRKAE